MGEIKKISIELIKADSSNPHCSNRSAFASEARNMRPAAKAGAIHATPVLFITPTEYSPKSRQQGQGEVFKESDKLSSFAPVPGGLGIRSQTPRFGHAFTLVNGAGGHSRQ
jgi:hypothetical protein